MSNEHLPQVGHSAVDQAFDGDGPYLDEGPLDPSVFFGLFDDLTADAGPEPAPDVAPSDDVERGGRPEEMNGHTGRAENGGAEDRSAGDDGAEDRRLDDDSGTGPEAAGGHHEPEPDASETTTPTISWWSNAPEEQRHDGRPIGVASPPPIPPGAARPEAGNAGTVETAGPFGETNGHGGDVSPTTVVTPIERDHSSNGAGPRARHVFTVPALDERLDSVLHRRSDATEPASVAIEQDAAGGGTVAKATLATIAVGLFAGLVVAFVLSLRSPDPALDGALAGDPAASSVAEDPPTGIAAAIAAGIRPTAELLAEDFVAALSSAMTDRADLTSLRFEPGTTDLDERSTAVVAEVGALLVDKPAVPVTIAVRTYTESTPAENRRLSIDQAEALAAALVEAGAAPDQIRVQGLGAAPLSQAQPVPNFVALTPQFGDRRFDEVLRGHSPFALGVPATARDSAWPLRPDGLLAIGALTDALSAFPDAVLGAAGYSFLPPSEAAIRSEADTAAADLVEFLVVAYGVDSERFTTIIPGSTLFVPTPEHGNHIWLQIGPASQGAFDVASVDPATITFEPGSADFDATGSAAVQKLADILISSGATIVVDVRSHESADPAADRTLSEARRDALTGALLSAGVAPEQLRMHASGASSYLLDDGGSAITITVAP